MTAWADASTAEVRPHRRLVSANLEHDLATLPAARDSLERRPGLRERKTESTSARSSPASTSALNSSSCSWSGSTMK